MIVIDTNVVSEALHPQGNPLVGAWFGRQPPRDLHLTAPSLAEPLIGIAIMPEGIRKVRLAQRFGSFLNQHFAERVLTFDRRATETYAFLLAHARRAGQAVSVIDGQIAAIASDRGFAVATRDVRPFAACGVPVINPWDPSHSAE